MSWRLLDNGRLTAVGVEQSAPYALISRGQLGVKPAPPEPPAEDPALLLQTGSYLLLQSGARLLLQGDPP